MNIGISLWMLGLIVLVAYIIQVTVQEPKPGKLLLFSYWLLFILTPLCLFGAVLRFSVIAFFLGFVFLLLLTAIGERGFRWWARLFGPSR